MSKKTNASDARHALEMAQHDKYEAVVRRVFESYKRSQHVASQKIRWTDGLVEQLAVELTHAFLAGREALASDPAMRTAFDWYDTPPDEREPAADILAELIEAVRS